MKVQPKVSDLVEILLSEIDELKQTIQNTSASHKNLENQLTELSNASIKIDSNEIDKKLSDFKTNLDVQIQKITQNTNNEKKETFLQKSDFKLLALTFFSSFLFGISVVLIYNQSKKIETLKDRIIFLQNDTVQNFV